MAHDRITKTAKIVLDSNGKTSVSKAMKEAGYPPTTAKNPQQVTRSKKWQKLMNKYLPEKHLQQRHREFLDAPRIVRTYKKGDLEIETEETDGSAVKALDMAYKLRGSYSAEKKEVSMPDDDMSILKEVLSALRK